MFILDTIRVYLRVVDTYQSRYTDEATTSNRTDGRYHSANTATTYKPLTSVTCIYVLHIVKNCDHTV